MSIYKRGNVYWCEWEIGGKRVRETTGATERQAAQEYHDRRRAHIWRASKLGDRLVQTWDEAALQWVDEHAVHKKSFETDRLRLKWLTVKLTGKSIDSITTDEMLKIRKELLITRSASTANRFLAVISAVLNYAHSKDKLSGVPKIPHLAEENERFIWLTQEQADAFIAELPTHLADMSRFSLATGLRRANVTELTWNDIDRNRNIAWIWADAAKGKKHINVPLNEDAMAVIKERYEQKDKDEKSARHPKYVFTYRGNPIFRVTTAAWYKAAKRAGIDPDFTFHGLRHTWASWHVMAGTPLEVLMKLGAWRSLDMVMRYAHLAPNFTANYAGNSKRVPTKSPTPALNQA